MPKFSFEKSKSATTEEVEKSDYVKRSEAEAKRRKHATESDIWLCFCFKTESERSSVLDILGLPEQSFFDSKEFLAAAQKVKPNVVKKGFQRKPKLISNTPDPLADVKYTGNLSQDCLKEAEALLAAMKAVRAPKKLVEITDSDVWFCVVFDSSDSRKDCLLQWNLSQYGERYLDGSSWLNNIAS